MSVIQEESRGRVCLNPMDKCSVNLLRILSHLSLPSNSTYEIVNLLSDVLQTILLAAASADSEAPLQSHVFKAIVKQVAMVQHIQKTNLSLLDGPPQIIIPGALQGPRTREYTEEMKNVVSRLSGCSRVMQATAFTISLALQFIKEWSDILSSINILDGCYPVESPSIFIEDHEEVWTNMFSLTNRLSFEEKVKLARAMPNCFLLASHEGCYSELSARPDATEYYSKFRERERKRTQQISFLSH